MTTFIVSKQIPIRRQEGDDADIVITVPSLFDLTNKTLKFQVNDSEGEAFIEKDLDNDISVDGQVITITLASEDTKGYAGTTNRWELEATDTVEEKITTIGKGQFIIESEIIL